MVRDYVKETNKGHNRFRKLVEKKDTKKKYKDIKEHRTKNWRVKLLC